MALNFNVDPYFDDFDPNKNFHRILFKPGFAVQARELTQSQTILQNQITSFADAIFAQNTPISGGKITINQNVYFLKLNSTDDSGASVIASDFNNAIVNSADGSIVAKVVATVESTTTTIGSEGDPPTIIVSYISGNKFESGDVIFLLGSNITGTIITASVGNPATGLSSIASISQGIFYVEGNFVVVNEQTIILSKYSSIPSLRVGLNSTETIIDSVDDSSLLDPAFNATNYQAPGADRYKISLELQTRTLQLGDDDNFIELVRLVDGSVVKQVNGTVYSVIDDYFAKRTNDTNGDFVVNDYTLTPKANTVNENLYNLGISKGIAYVGGYRLENQSDVTLTNNRARTIATVSNNPAFIDYGNFFYVNSANGVFDVTTSPQVDFHTVDTSNIVGTNANSYNSTRAATAYIRSMTYDSTSNTANGSAYVYKAYIYNIQNQTLTANARVGSANNTFIALPTTNQFSNVANAYTGVTISIDTGTSAGDFRTITTYDAAAKIAYVDTPFTVSPETDSQFTIRFDTTDFETMTRSTVGTPYSITANAAINTLNKVNNVASGDVVLQNPNQPELLFTIGNPFVSFANNSSYTTTQVFRNVSFTVSGGNIVAALTFGSAPTSTIRFLGNGTLSSDAVSQNFQIMVTNPLSSGLRVGQLLPWNTGSRTCSITALGGTATFTTPTSDLGAFTATIIAKAFVSNGNDTSFILKAKNLVTGNTAGVNLSGTTVETYTNVDLTNGQVYVANAGVVAPGQPQKLYITDAKRIVKIIDTKSPGAAATTAMLTNPINDVTNRFTFDNGQRDSYYDFATITLGIGQPQIDGNLLVILDYYSTTGGDGYYSVMSYLSPVSSAPESYANIPSYMSSTGNFYQLRDSLDFRPSLINAQSSFIIRTSSSGSGAAGAYIPVDLTEFESDYGFYLGRFDKLVLSKDRAFEIVQGTPSTSPILPIEPDGSLVLANIYHDPYTAYLPGEAIGVLPSLSLERVKHKRWLMRDISSLESRVNNIEYYTALNLLEKGAASLQIPDGNGLNRFKNGILVDDFSSYAASDTARSDYFVSVNRRTKQMTAAQEIQNFPLQSLALVYNMGQLDSTSANNLGFKISKSSSSNFFTLPYTTANVVSQRIASRVVNLNPFSVSLNSGTITLSPPMDNWVDTEKSPDLLIVDPNLQVYRASDEVNVLQVGDWKTTVATSTDNVIAAGRNWRVNQVTTYTTEQQKVILGNYDKLNSSYIETAGYITDVSVLPYIRAQFIFFNTYGLTVNTNVNAYFDSVPVNNYIRKPNVIELNNVSGSFNDGDVIGYLSSGNFTPAAKVVSYYRYPNSTTNVRLYVVGDIVGQTFTAGATIRNAQFNTSGQYQTSTASGIITSFEHNSGRVTNVDSSTSITLGATASPNNNIYNGNTISIINGTGIGQTSTISAYNGTTKIATLDSVITTANNDIYSIGGLRTNEAGMVSGIFALPGGQFNTGQRPFRIDDSVGGNISSAQTFAEGTFYASGLQQTKQGINYASSIDSAKNTFTRTNERTNITSYTYTTVWDPVAQTFIIDKENYPNGCFVDSIKIFFRTKASQYAPVTLSIVGTLNGYPNGDTLDNSQVTLTTENVKVSSNPHYLDPNTFTVFKFPAPVYLESNKLYSLIIKCPTSNEYTIYTAQNGDTALASSVKNLPSDPTPTTITKISAAPYVGSLFISQNSQTWEPDQNESMMFTIDRCVFSVGTQPTLQYVVPNRLPYRKLTEEDVSYFLNPNTINTSISSAANTNVIVDAFNVSTTDFIPGSTTLSYSYAATLNSNKSVAPTQSVTPGKFGTPTYDDIYLNDGLGERVLVANSNTSFSLFANMTTVDDAVSPMISDDGLGVYTISWSINNMELYNDIITVSNGGSGYNVNTTSVTITSNSGSGATATANVVGGVIRNINITNGGSGYITTPIITVTDANSAPGTGATIVVSGETSPSGGNALARYITKKVILDQGFDSGDLRVYFTAYRPVNTNIHVYYKVLSRSDTQTFDSGNWQLMTLINNTDSLYSQTRDGTYEFVAAPGVGSVAQNYIEYASNVTGQTYNNFSQFQIKVVLTSSDNTFVPYLSDIRAIALPSAL